MSDELKDFRYYAEQAEQYLDEADRLNGYDPAKCSRITAIAVVYAELAKAAPKVESAAPVRCPEWLSRGVRDLPRGFIDYQCVLFAGHGVEHESSTGKYWLTESGTSA
jgi:hypothetical protein